MTTETNLMQPPEVLRFPSEGQYCVTDFYRPEGQGPFPTLVMAHGLGGTRKMRLPAFAERFAAAGYACLVFDYRHFGDSDGQPRQILEVSRQLTDWRSAIAFARSLKEVDATRLAIWGTSFGGGHVLSIAAEDAKLAAVISQCPFTHGIASSLLIRPDISLKLTALAVSDLVRRQLGLAPVLLPLAGRPGDTAFMTSPDSHDGYLKLAEHLPHFRNEVAARLALEIIRYFPSRKTHRIQAPVLFCVCDTDSVAPSGPTIACAKRTPRHEIKRYPDGHFDIYVGTAFEKVVKDQLDFLKKTIPS